MFTDFYLKFTSESEAVSILYTITPEIQDEEGNVIQEAQTKPNYRNIDTLGILYDNTDPENPIALPGWHVNVRCLEDEDPNPLEVYKVNPEPMHWRRVWA